MEINGWRYYNSAAVPTTPPTVDPDTDAISNKSIWSLEGKTPLLARWTTDFDCGYETNWWYVIKDTVFDVSALKAKRRYEINKGDKNFEIRLINPTEYAEALLDVQIAAFSAYPKKYRPTVNRESFVNSVGEWEKDYVAFAAFNRENNEISGYALLKESHQNYVEFAVLKTKPQCEKLSVNAALVAGVLKYFEGHLAHGGIICDGARSIYHETAFQDYLEKYFEFRKAYCRLHVSYNPRIKWVISLLFPFRGLLRRFDSIKIANKINSVLRMEELCREGKAK